VSVDTLKLPEEVSKCHSGLENGLNSYSRKQKMFAAARRARLAKEIGALTRLGLDVLVGIFTDSAEYF
jgi:hypothetical protein